MIRILARDRKERILFKTAASENAAKAVGV